MASLACFTADVGGEVVDIGSLFHACAQADRRRLIVPNPALVGAGLGLLFVTSLHHIFTIVGPENVQQFVAVQILGALLLAAGLIYMHRTAPGRVVDAASLG